LSKPNHEEKPANTKDKYLNHEGHEEKNQKIQITNTKWFGQLTILNQVEGQISKSKCQNIP